MAHSSSRRCQSWFERASRDGFQGEDGPDLAHRHIADQDLEVLPVRHRGTGLTKIAVEDPDLLRPPTERCCLGHQIVLALRALLMEAHLPHRRLPNVDASLPRQVSIGDLRAHDHRAPPRRTAGPRRDKTRPYRPRWRPPWRSRERREPDPWRSIQSLRVVARVLR